jgi:site-specific DNA recombinase
MVALASAPRAAIYVRVSTPGQKEDGYSLEGQVSECLSLAERIGATVQPHLIFREVGSGADWDLPRLLDVLDRAQRREFDVLICLATSRLARDVGKLAVLQRTLKRADVTVHYVHHRFDDTPTGQLTETMLAAIDVYERQNATLRFALGKRAKVARNLVMGNGPIPYGYRAVRSEKGRTVALEIDPVTEAIVQRIFREAAFRPLVDICVGLDADGVTPPGRAARWSEGTVGAMLRNPVYVGRSAYGRRRWLQVVGPDGRKREVRIPRDESEVQYADCPALVTAAEQRAAIAAMADRKRRHAGFRCPEPEHPYTLRGMLSCGLCGGALSVQRNGTLRYYLCLRYQAERARKQGRERCALPSVPADGLEAEAWRLICSVLLDPEQLSTGLEEALAGEPG